MFDWYSNVVLKLGDNANRTECSKDNVNLIVVQLCDVHGVGYTNPEKSTINFITLEAAAEICENIAASHAHLAKTPVADGISVNLSDIYTQFIDLAEHYHARAAVAAETATGLENNGNVATQSTIIMKSDYDAQEAEPLSTPVIDIRYGSTTTVILWDVDESVILQKTDVYINEAEDVTYSTTKRYENKYTITNSETTLATVKIVKTDVYDREVEVIVNV